VVVGGVVLDALIEVTVALPDCGAAEFCLSAVHAVTISTGATTPSTSPVPTRHRRPLPNVCMIRTISPPAPAALPEKDRRAMGLVNWDGCPVPVA
jgi:hypothetical protein